MKPIKIIRAFYTVWKSDIVLSNYTLRSTRMTKATNIPYALIEAVHIGHEYSSATNHIADYSVKITFFVGEDKTLASQLSTAMTNAFDFHLFAFTDAYTISCIPDYENPELDKDTDKTSQDVNVIKQAWTIKLNETN
jgi:hypothetical protein